MLRLVRSIVIVGGGSSGWMSAAYLKTVFPDLAITLIESKRVPVIGVGEATVPSLTRFVSRLGFAQPRDWLAQCDGTIKAGIRFRHWHERGDDYWHPFEGLDYFDDHHHTGHSWLNLHARGTRGFETRQSFSEQFNVTNALNCAQKRGPVVATYAYHLNADRFGDLLKRVAAGVRHVLDDVVDIVLAPNGDIESLTTAEHGSLRGDLFIDCTGFRRALIRTVDPHQTFQSNASSLFCDRAVVLRFPYDSDEARVWDMDPYVTAAARSSGWTWKIPLYSRISSGYVYSSSFLSEDAAERELRDIWGHERTKDAVAHKVRFETGKLTHLWVNNCVAIGLAGGFVEPLESTGLAITQTGLEMLASVLDARCYDEGMTARYNMHLQKYCTDIVNFIIAHYCLTNREDTPFWRAVKHDTVLPDELSARLDVFRRLLPTLSTRGMEELWAFRDFSWFAVLLGMNFRYDTPRVPEAHLERALRLAHTKQRFVRQVGAKAPSHLEWLNAEVYGTATTGKARDEAGAEVSAGIDDSPAPRAGAPARG